MSKLAKHTFWLDGGYDIEAVTACPKHPYHDWWTFRLGDVLEPTAIRNPDEMMVICRHCYVPRCGATDDPTPCLKHRHHRGDHAERHENVGR